MSRMSSCDGPPTPSRQDAVSVKPPARHWHATYLAAAMAVLAAAEIAVRVFDAPAGVTTLGTLALFAALIGAMPLFGPREWFLTGVSGLLALGLQWTWLSLGSDPTPTPHVTPDAGLAPPLARALEQSAFFCGFIFTMTLLKEAAITSPAIRTVGAYLTKQPPGRRYLATSWGGQLMGVLLNFGAISLLAPLVQQGVRAEPVAGEPDARAAQDRRQAIRERRQLSALIRGFSWMLVWTPTTLTYAVITTSIPGVQQERMIVIGLITSVLMFGVGWSEDRLRWRAAMRRRSGPFEPVAFPKPAFLALAQVCAALLGGTALIRVLFGATITESLMMAAPLLLVAWVFQQNRDRGARRAVAAVAQRWHEIVRGPMKGLTRDAVGFGAAGFIGVAAAALAPVDDIANWLALGSIDQSSLTAWLITITLPIIILVAGSLALSPLMIVVFLGSLLSALPGLPAKPEYLCQALAAGWALSLTAAPNATGALFTANATGHSSLTLTWRWNGLYSLAALAVFAVWMFVLIRFF